jgi:hypothetical protein
MSLGAFLMLKMRIIKSVEGLDITVDNGDYSLLKDSKWRVNSHGYVFRNETINHKNTFISLHRFLMNFPNGTVDHINGDKLDNQRENLRICKFSDNNKNQPRYKNNKSGYKGVTWHSRHNYWEAHIGVNGKQLFLGKFNDKKEAALTYNYAAQKYHGEFARLNQL